MSAVLYEVRILNPADGTPDTSTWLDQQVRQVLEQEGFESGRAYRTVAVVDAGGAAMATRQLVLQFRVRSADELEAFRRGSEAVFLSAVSQHFGSAATVQASVLRVATELATPSDAAGSQAVSECPNCGAVVTGKFCGDCGQDNRVSVVAFHRLVADFIREFFNFDSRLFASIGPLLVKPGFLTVEYLAGRRATYLPPVRMTLFLSVIFFGLVAWQANRAIDISMPDAVAAGEPAAAGEVIPPKRQFDLELGLDERIELTAAPAGWLKVMEDRASKNLRRLGADGDYQRDVLQKAIGNLPAMMFVLVPVFAFLLKLLHLRSGRYYVEHLILSMHLHAFNFLTLTVLAGLSLFAAGRAVLSAIPGWLWAAGWTYFGLYPWLAMRRVYRQGFLRTSLKFGLSALVYVLLLVLGTVATALVSLSL